MSSWIYKYHVLSNSSWEATHFKHPCLRIVCVNSPLTVNATTLIISLRQCPDLIVTTLFWPFLPVNVRQNIQLSLWHTVHYRILICLPWRTKLPVVHEQKKVFSIWLWPFIICNVKVLFCQYCHDCIIQFNASSGIHPYWCTIPHLLKSNVAIRWHFMYRRRNFWYAVKHLQTIFLLWIDSTTGHFRRPGWINPHIITWA